MSKLTQDRIKELVWYNLTTGNLIWLNNSCRTKKNEIAGSLNKLTGYMQIGVDCKLYQLHRIIWLYMEGYLPENDIDHINGVKDDNRWVNLRHLSHQCNSRNRNNLNRNNISGVTGVSWHRVSKSWHVQISSNRKSNCLGYYKDFDKAVKVRYRAEIDYNYKNFSSAYSYLSKNELL